MFGRQIDPAERHKVLELLIRWSHAMATIDTATDEIRQFIVDQPLGMQSSEFENVCLNAVRVVMKIQKDATNKGFWPALKDKKATKILSELQANLDKSCVLQLKLLDLYKLAASAFRSLKEYDAPSLNEMTIANKAFTSVLDDMGLITGKLAKRYKVAAEEYQGDQ
ncbi:hypothetical protein ACFLYB_01725 [Chloroflexota bacterium]